MDHLLALLCLRTDGVAIAMDLQDADEDQLVCLQDKRDLGLGKPLAVAFARTLGPREAEAVREIFGRRGAYARFKAFPVGRGALDAWYAFSDQAEKEALRAWCADEGLEVEA